MRVRDSEKERSRKRASDSVSVCAVSGDASEKSVHGHINAISLSIPRFPEPSPG